MINYEEYLSTIVNTRLIYNTIEEYEDKLDNHSLHNNGVKRCLNTKQKLRTAFRDFQVETLKLTTNQVDLEELLIDYKHAWNFYSENLSRRRNPMSYVHDLLRFYYPPYLSENLVKAKRTIFRKIVEEHINVPILILMLMKILPGYDSKEGNVYNISRKFSQITSLLQDFTSRNNTFSVFPAIIRAKDEGNKSRLKLIYYTTLILDSYKTFTASENLYDQFSFYKSIHVDLDIDGYWNQCSGELNCTIFWHIQHALNDGTYFISYWHKDSNNVLTGINFTMYLSETPDRKLMAYVLHPNAINQRIKCLPYSDRDNTWYESEFPCNEHPMHFNFKRTVSSQFWPNTFNITRVTDPLVIETYDKWFDTCEIKQLFSNLDYTFIPNLYAVTIDNLYIPINKDNTQFYKVPRTAYPGLENIQIGDLVGLMKMGDKEYIVFDELLLYVETTEEQLAKYNIQKVDYIE